MRVAVVGAGFGARVVAPAYAAVPGCEVVVVASPRDAHAAAAACERPDVDLVSVHSPPFLHREHVHRALDAGHAVLCDKPFGRHAADAEAMLDHARSAGVVHGANLEFRFDPGRRLLRDMLAGGAVGRVHHLTWVHLSAGTTAPLRPYGWLFDRERGGGWIGAWASHTVDALRWMLGEVEDARGWPRTDVPERPDGDGAWRRCSAEDALIAELRLRDGVTVAIDSGFALPASSPPRVTVLGEDGTIESVADREVVLRRADGTTERPEPASAGAGADRHAGPMGALVRALLAAVRGHEVDPDLPDLVDAVHCARVLDRLRAGPSTAVTAARASS